MYSISVYIDFRLDSLVYVQARFRYDILSLLKRALKCNIMYSQAGFLFVLPPFTHAGGLTTGQLVGIIVGSIVGFFILFCIPFGILIYLCNKCLAARRSRENLEASYIDVHTT